MGQYFPSEAVEMKVVGDSFIDIVKLFIAPIIFLTIVLGISSMGDLSKVGRIGLKSLIYFCANGTARSDALGLVNLMHE